MVIGEKFAWAHLPKTGGNATLTFFRVFRGLIQFADPAGTNDKHLNFLLREKIVAGKVLAVNIRRLPAWMLSHARHESELLHGKKMPMPSAEEISRRTLGDKKLKYMTADGK